LRTAQRRNPPFYHNRLPANTALLPLPVLPRPKPLGCPIHRALCDGLGCKPSTTAEPPPLPLPVAFPTQNKEPSFRPKPITRSLRTAQRRNPVLYTTVSQPTALLPLPVLLSQPKPLGCPIHRALCDGWDLDRQPLQNHRLCRCLFLSPLKTKNRHFDQKADHTFFANRAAEKSGSLHNRLPAHRALAFARSPLPAETARVPHPRALCDGWDLDRQPLPSHRFCCCLCLFLSHSKQRTVIFDQSRSHVLCEPRNGEIRLSTSSKPPSNFCLGLPSIYFLRFWRKNRMSSPRTT
jgi:hypothetical protein